MADKKTYITGDGFIKLKKELEDLKNTKRKEIADRIQDAKELGDLSENAEYAEAKNEQAFVEGRIAQLENLLKNVTIIDNSGVVAGKDSVVHVGCQVQLQVHDKPLSYTIVGSNEADPEKGFISNESPLGQAFLGHKIGEEIEIDVPSGKVMYKILGIK